MIRLDHSIILSRLLLLGTALLIFTHQITLGELFLNNDETRHAMTGVYFYDLFKDFPASFNRFYDYTWEYYARYPALGLLWWPPFSYVVEAGFYSLFGVSATVGRLTIVFFALVGLYFWYKLIRAMYGERIAWFASLFFIANPYIARYSKYVMLEIPSLALCLATIYFFYRYTEQPNRKYLIGSAISFALALLTKMHTIFMAPLFLLYLWRAGKVRWLWRRDVLGALGLIILLAAPYSLFALKIQGGRFFKALAQGSAANLSTLTVNGLFFYPLSLGEQLGLLVLLPSSAYLGVLLSQRSFGRETLFICWILACFALFAFIAEKAARYTIYWIPPFLLMAVLFMDQTLRSLRNARWATAAIGLLSAALLVQAYTTDKRFIRGYEEAAKYIVQNYTPKTTVFFHGYYDGNLIFHIRKWDPARRIPILIGTKMLATMNITPEYGMEVLVSNENGIEKIFADYGTQYIVLEDLDRLAWGDKVPPVFNVLRQMVQSPNYRLVKQIPIETNIPIYHGHRISIYENQKRKERQSDWIRFKMLSMGGREVSIKLQ